MIILSAFLLKCLIEPVACELAGGFSDEFYLKLPALWFFVGAAFSFFLGSAFATMSILLPLLEQLSSGNMLSEPLFLCCCGAVVSGALWGNQTSLKGDNLIIVTGNNMMDVRPVEQYRYGMKKLWKWLFIMFLIYLVVPFLGDSLAAFGAATLKFLGTLLIVLIIFSIAYFFKDKMRNFFKKFFQRTDI